MSEYPKNRKTDIVSKLQVLPNGVNLYQAEGTQFTTDSLHLAESIDMPPRSRIAELGCGTGGVIFSAALRNPDCSWVGLDIQENLLQIMMCSALLQEPKIDLTAICCNVENIPLLLQGGTFDAIMANPPFKVAGCGRESPVYSRRVSRSGDSILIYQFIRAAAHLLKKGGAFAIAGTPEMLPKITLGCETYNLEIEETGNIMLFVKCDNDMVDR
ncbi:MAG: methyltransferase domain-containing protein [FCB group bacterium]|nr:methyltransferase domain-containing protein [FCB group bacterium]